MEGPENKASSKLHFHTVFLPLGFFLASFPGSCCSSQAAPPSHFELLLTFPLHRVPPHVEVIKRSQSDEANETVEIFELILDGSARHCPTVVCEGRREGREMEEERQWKDKE